MSKSTEVSAKATRRRFSTSEKIRILGEADACTGKGVVSALMRREGIYSSQLSTWRAQRAAGQFGESPCKRGPVSAAADSRDKQIVELERRAVRAEARADRAERLCALQKRYALLDASIHLLTEALPEEAQEQLLDASATLLEALLADLFDQSLSGGHEGSCSHMAAAQGSVGDHLGERGG